MRREVVEDVPGCSFDRLREEGFGETVIEALESVTKREGEGYDAFVRCGRGSPVDRCASSTRPHLPR